MRRPILNLALVVIVLTLSLSFVAILPAAGQGTGRIISKLRELGGKVEGEHPCLENKVNAVIHQIEAGAFNGALNKLENDVKKSIIAWVEDPEDLIDLVDEIIDLIRGITPPSPDFDISADPEELEIEQGKSDTSTITVTSLHGFSQRIDISAELTPATNKVSLVLDPTWVIPTPNGKTSTLNVVVDADAEARKYVITVTGTNGTVSRVADIILIVTAAPGFSIAASLTSLTIQQGDSDRTTIIIASSGGFNQSVALKVTPESIEDIKLTLDLAEVTPPKNGFATSTLTIEVANNASTGQHTITVTGTSGALEPKSVNILLEVVVEKTPPIIVSVLRQPEKPSYNETVTILASVTDARSGVDGVILSYSGGATWKNETMTPTDGLFRRTIPAFPFNTLVKYLVYASDNVGNPAVPSNVYSYVVADPYPPVIGYPSWSPEKPGANEEITINVTVTEPPYSSGVKEVILWYVNTTMDLWQSTPMTFKDGNWTATITDQSGTDVTFFVEASDKAGNKAETEELELKVAGPAGVPLAWILLAIAVVAAGTGGGIYYWRRRRKKSGGKVASSTPT